MSAGLSKPAFVEHLFAGKPAPFGPKGSPSSIIKQKHQRLHIKINGAEEDEQGNKKIHGGPYMAMHQYSQQAYTILQQQFPNTPQKIAIGTIGENISAPHMNEDTVHIGDQFKMGDVILKVVSPRAPCANINHRYGERKIDLFVAQRCITGWYYSVVKTGIVELGDSIELIEKENKSISVKDIWQMRRLRGANDIEMDMWREKAESACSLASLAPEWQKYMRKLLP